MSAKHGEILVMLITGYISVVNSVLEANSMTARSINYCSSE
jgi:hypothetical protein